MVRRLLPSSLLLAGPGVLLGAGITAVLVKYTFPHDWTWGQCLLFGAMFSATDPVAVVAVLREAGLSKRLRTLVDLEALLNDGTAYVLFFVLRRFVVDASNAAAGQDVGGEPTTVATALVQFVRLAVGGAALGLAFGVATTAWLRYMYNAPMPEITITFASAFLTYLVGDRLLGVSGVVGFVCSLFRGFSPSSFSGFPLHFFFYRKEFTAPPPPPPPPRLPLPPPPRHQLAVVVLGLWMTAAGVNHVSRKVERPLDVVWEVLEYCANTVIFLLAGALVAARVYTNLSNPLISDIKWFDFPMALALWVYLLLARAAMFVLFWPVLKRSGYGMTPREGLVLAWSGLRGAVGLALSLFVVLDFQNAPGIADRQFGELCFFYMGAITLLTLLVQGVSMAPLLRRLGMTKPPSVRRSFLKLLLRQVESRGDECMRLAAEDKVLGDPDWRVVGELSALEASEMLKRYDSGGGGGGKKGKKGKSKKTKKSKGERVAEAGLGAALVRLVPASLRGKEAKRNEGEQQQQAAANGGAHANGGDGGGGGGGKGSSLSLGGEGPSESGARGGGAAARGEGIECMSYFVGLANAFGVELQDSF